MNFIEWNEFIELIELIELIEMMLFIDWSCMKLHEAEACLIMSNPTSSDPDSEDAANIMRVISVKNYDPRVRVIVQLMHYRNKVIVICNYTYRLIQRLLERETSNIWAQWLNYCGEDYTY